MSESQGSRGLLSILSVAYLLLAGCVTDVGNDDVTVSQTGAHCSGSEGVDDFSIAVLPIPLVTYFVPHANLHEIKTDE